MLSSFASWPTAAPEKRNAATQTSELSWARMIGSRCSLLLVGAVELDLVSGQLETDQNGVDVAELRVFQRQVRRHFFGRLHRRRVAGKIKADGEDLLAENIAGGVGNGDEIGQIDVLDAGAGAQRGKIDREIRDDAIVFVAARGGDRRNAPGGLHIRVLAARRDARDRLEIGHRGRGGASVTSALWAKIGASRKPQDG